MPFDGSTLSFTRRLYGNCRMKLKTEKKVYKDNLDLRGVRHLGSAVKDDASFEVMYIKVNLSCTQPYIVGPLFSRAASLSVCFTSLCVIYLDFNVCVWVRTVDVGRFRRRMIRSLKRGFVP